MSVLAGCRDVLLRFDGDEGGNYFRSSVNPRHASDVLGACLRKLTNTCRRSHLKVGGTYGCRCSGQAAVANYPTVNKLF